MLLADGENGTENVETARDDDAMEIDGAEEDAQNANPQKAKLAQVRAEISNVLKFKDFETLRSAKLSQDAFLLLLSKFNEAGLHFS